MALAPKGPRALPTGKCFQGPCVTAKGCSPHEPRGGGEDLNSSWGKFLWTREGRISEICHYEIRRGATSRVPLGIPLFPMCHPLALQGTPTFPERVATSVGQFPLVSTPLGAQGTDLLPTGDVGGGFAGP